MKPSKFTLGNPPSEAELSKMQHVFGLGLPPTHLTYELRLGVSGEGVRAYDWSDKHRRCLSTA